ncbi:hypothetical protein [Aliiruegeria lutimaris]|uniref:Uncharacterized protein n=1 Tax=Aliiruegeria lutimaris TaxID=571298 RepID=A0A1G8IYF3_9RHOB|nr:hypothetical protein [Aliiruegeria lutimaris]SDI24004.1 hypothetical protein SAMN04488026_1001167 [Aliiruegeria lutimaris]
MSGCRGAGARQRWLEAWEDGQRLEQLDPGNFEWWSMGGHAIASDEGWETWHVRFTAIISLDVKSDGFEFSGKTLSVLENIDDYGRPSPPATL